MEQTTRNHAPSASVALRWLGRQLAWERTLAELRDPSCVATQPIDDEVAA